MPRFVGASRIDVLLRLFQTSLQPIRRADSSQASQAHVPAWEALKMDPEASRPSVDAQLIWRWQLKHAANLSRHLLPPAR